MADFNRTANSAYYASKQELNIRGTREGSKTPKNVASYQHTSSDGNTSANKYYASAASSPGKPRQAKARAAKHVQLGIRDDKAIVQAILEELANGATRITVKGSAQELNQARTSVDIAVGRNTLTRAQADSVNYAVQAETKPIVVPDVKIEPVAEPEPEVPAVEDEPVKEDITEADVAAAFGVTDDEDNDL